MPKVFEVESREKEKPIVLIYGHNNPLFPLLIEKFQKDFKIIVVSENNAFSEKSPLYYVRDSQLDLVEKIEEKIDYAVIFLEKQDDKKSFASLSIKLERDKTKTAVIVSVTDAFDFCDLIISFKKNANLFFLILGELFGKTINSSVSTVAKIISSAIKNKSISLTGNDLLPIYPISDDDALKGINQTLFGANKKEHLLYLFYKHPQTFISSVHLLKRVEPDLEIKFEEKQSFTLDKKISFDQLESEIKNKTLLKPDYLDTDFIGFENSIKEMDSKDASFQQSERVEKEKPNNKNAAKRKKPIKLLFLGTLIAYMILVFLLSLGSLLSINQAYSAIQNGDIKKFSLSVKNANTFFSFAEPTISTFDNLISFLPINNFIGTNYQTMKEGISVLSIVESDSEKIKNISHGLLASDLDSLFGDIYFLSFESNNISLEKTKAPVKSFASDLATFATLIQIIPQVFGYNQDKNYLILFQNNGEIRPTGGFIGSVGELSLSKGKVTNFGIRDVYEIDGQLKAHVEPHYIIRRYLQPHLYLRDSNFNPDFENSASTSALLYSLGTKGKRVDGVIAIDYEVLKQIIKMLGPIKLQGYNKTLDESNTFEFLQNTIQSNFFPGSTQKRDVLNDLFNQISIKTFENESNIYKISKLIPILIKQKHILFAFNDGSIQKIFSINGFSNSFTDLRTTENSTNDFLSVNEANIGVNKANINIERKIEYEVDLSNIDASSKITLTLDNKSSNDNYKTYLRTYVPKGSVLESVKINNKEQKLVPAVTDFRTYERKNFKPPQGLEVDTSIENGKLSFGFITEVPKNTSQIIEVYYNNGIKSYLNPLVNYSLRYLKQPGTVEYPIKIGIKYGTSYKAQSDLTSSISNNIITFQKNIDSDQEFIVKFVK